MLKSHSVLSCVAPNLSQWNSIPQKSYPEKQKNGVFWNVFFWISETTLGIRVFFRKVLPPLLFPFQFQNCCFESMLSFRIMIVLIVLINMICVLNVIFVCVCLWPIAPRAKLSQNWSWPSNMFFLFCLVILLPWSWFNWVWLSWFWCVLKPKIPMDKILRAGPGINFQFKHQHVPTSLGWNSCTDLQDTYGLNFGPESGTPKKRLKVGLEPKSFSQGPQRGILQDRLE